MATRLVHISDVHFGVENRAALAEIDRVIREEQPDALVCTGDITQRATHRQFADAERWFARFDIPIWLEPGNHDMPYGNLWERFTAPYDRYNALREAVAVPHFETQDLVLVPLKTTVRAQNRWPWSDGVVRPRALERTLSALHDLPDDGRVRIVTAHHPLHAPQEGEPSPTFRGNKAFARLAEAGMNAILTGHVHRPFHEVRRAGAYHADVIGAGTISTRLRHSAPGSYNFLTIKRAPAQGQPGTILVDTRTVSVATSE